MKAPFVSTVLASHFSMRWAFVAVLVLVGVLGVTSQAPDYVPVVLWHGM